MGCRASTVIPDNGNSGAGTATCQGFGGVPVATGSLGFSAGGVERVAVGSGSGEAGLVRDVVGFGDGLVDSPLPGFSFLPPPLPALP